MALRARVYALKLKGQSTAQIATALGVCEGTVRYHVRRYGCEDGRKNKPRKVAAVAPAIDHWIHARYTVVDGHEPGRRPRLRGLHAWLRKEHGYEGSGKSVERYVRQKYDGHRLEPKVQELAAVGGFSPSWVLRFLVGKQPLSALREEVGDLADLPLLYRAAREGRCKKRNKALTVLGFLKNNPAADIARTLQLEQKTVESYWKTYTDKGGERLVRLPMPRRGKVPRREGQGGGPLSAPFAALGA
jgi:transposase